MADLLPFATSTTARWVRPRTFTVTHVDLAITVDLAARTVAGTVTHTLRWIGRPQPEVVFDQHDLAISAVRIDGAPATFSTGTDAVRIATPDGAGASTRSVALDFSTTNPRKGMFFIAAEGDRVAMAWTQGAMEDHAHWFPCFDSPNNLSTYRIAIRHLAAFTGLAGGQQESRTEHGDGWATTVYVQDRPHVLYLLNVVVGDLVGVADPAAPVPVTHWLPRGREACAPAVFRATAFAIAELGRFIGVPYPWQRYGHVVVHRFMWGGMENTTLTTISDRVLLTPEEQQREEVDADSLVIHELVHQWFGDLLTMKGWSDIWLNESFATYLEARITARWRAQRQDGAEADVLALELWHNRSAYLDQHCGRYQRPLVTNRWDDAYELFDRVAYEQGSLVLHTLCSWLGEERFAAVLQLYASRHAHGLVETADFRRAIEDATGEPADWFFEQWVYRAGNPALTVNWSHDPARNQVAVTIEQSEPVYRLPLAIGFGGGDLRRIEVTKPRETFVFPVSTAPAWVMADPAGEVLATWDETHPPKTLEALIVDSQAPAHARARACVAAAKLFPSVGLRSAVQTAAAAPAELVREEALNALAAWLDAEGLLAAYRAAGSERQRRQVAGVFSRLRGTPAAAGLAEQLLTWADAATSDATAGELLAARGALEVPGATPLLRARLARPGWNQRRLLGAIRGLGASGEASALDELLCLLSRENLPDVVVPAVLSAVGGLGARHPLARERVRRALLPYLDEQRSGALLTFRVAAARALVALADPAALSALRTQREREPFGNVRRVLREAIHALEQVAATTTATAALTRRIDDLEGAKTRLEARLDALEKRLSAP